MSNLNTDLLDQAEALDAIAQLLHAGLAQGEIQISASIKACERDLRLYAQAIRVVAANIESPWLRLDSVLLSPLLHRRISVRFGKACSKTDIGELLEDYTSCGLEMLTTSLDVLSSSDGGSRSLIQAHTWLEEAYSDIEAAFEATFAYWGDLEQEVLAA